MENHAIFFIVSICTQASCTHAVKKKKKRSKRQWSAQLFRMINSFFSVFFQLLSCSRFYNGLNVCVLPPLHIVKRKEKKKKKLEYARVLVMFSLFSDILTFVY